MTNRKSDSSPRVLILRAAGTNCDAETQHAFEIAGASCERVHINRVLENPSMLEQVQILAIPGGFSYGDDIAAGKILATQLSNALSPALKQFVASKKPVIGICNGFQVLVKTDLLPGPLANTLEQGQLCTLAHNTIGRFQDHWVHLQAPQTHCIWTKDLIGKTISLPVAHGEGRFLCASDAVRTALHANGHVALRYTRHDGSAADGEFPHNPNGSTDDIAGICDATGLVFGLMPHPERHINSLQHPTWTSRESRIELPAEGLSIFAGAVSYCRSTL